MAAQLSKAAKKLPPRLMSLADLSPSQISNIITLSAHLKHKSKAFLDPTQSWRSSTSLSFLPTEKHAASASVAPSLQGMAIALLFSKRSTRTRVAAETASHLLGGNALFLGKDDIQLGVNETARDTAQVLSGMCQGIFARVNEHEEIEELARYADIPVLNALSSLWHPTQTLADILTLTEERSLWKDPNASTSTSADQEAPLDRLRPLTIAYVGDSTNVLHDMLVAYPRLGHSIRVATPPAYRAPEPIWARIHELGINVSASFNTTTATSISGNANASLVWTEDPREAVHGADVVVTDTWISMGQESEYAERVKAFAGYQVTERLCREGGAKEGWKFLHCLPRKPHEVDDEVMYGPRSLVFQEAENRKWTIMALFHMMFGNWTLDARL